MISQKSIEEVLSVADISEVISEFVELRKRGSNFTGLCPFHQEKTPSFTVSPVKRIFKCFGCGRSGDVVTFLREYKGFTFPEAIRYLAGKYHILLEESSRNLTDEEKREAKDHESAKNAMLMAQDYFQKAIAENNAFAEKARLYAYGRWPKEFCEDFGIGYAPGDPKGFLEYMKSNSVSENILVELGLLFYDKEHNLQTTFRNRIMIPDRNRSGVIINFMGRTLSNNPDISKYINLHESKFYKKGNNLFGIDAAFKAGRSENKVYLVEGAPDVMRLRLIGYNNVVATLGTSWTNEQFNLLKRISANIVFIPDTDIPENSDPNQPNSSEEDGPGIKAVMRAGQMAVELGFTVMVKEIPPGHDDAGKAVSKDPDTYFIEPSLMCSLQEEDFVKWYADKLLSKARTQSEIKDCIKQVCKILASIKDETSASIFLEIYPKRKNGGKMAWTKAYREIISDRQSEKKKQHDNNSVIQQPGSNAGYFISNNGYCSYGKNDEIVRWSNFVIKPFYDVLDNGIRIKLFTLINDAGQEQLVDFTAEDLGSMQNFRRKLNNAGSYIWFSKIEELMKVLEPAYCNSIYAKQVSKLGLQKNQSYAFGNGLLVDDTFYPADENGMVTVADLGTYYFPAFSPLHKDNDNECLFEKSFIYNNITMISLKDYVQRLVTVFGDNAKVGVAYILASAYHDVIFKHHTFFPIFNLVGEKGSGKSQLAMALKSFYIADNRPINIESQSFAACNLALSQVENSVIHFDEYKNSISIQKLEMLKGAYDGVGRVKIKDGSMEYMSCRNGIILTGQEMTTLDIALFARTIYLTTDKCEYTAQEREAFEELSDIRKKGLSNLLGEILSCRERMKEDYYSHYKVCLRDVLDKIETNALEDRILKNWVVVLATYHCLEKVLGLPFSYEDLLDFCVPKMLEQNKLIKQNNEVGNFWEFLFVQYQEGRIRENGDYKIQTCETLRVDGSTKPIDFGTPRRILYLRPSRILALYQKDGNQSNQIMMSKGSLRQYLSKSKGALGKAKIRYDRIIDGQVQYEKIEKTDGTVVRGRKLYEEERSLVFDYDIISEVYGITLLPETEK